MFSGHRMSSAKQRENCKKRTCYGPTLAWRHVTDQRVAPEDFRKFRIFCAVHKNILDRRSRGFYISVVLRCSETERRRGQQGFIDLGFIGPGRIGVVLDRSSASAAEWLIRSIIERNKRP
jgi:hypothetical protein